ncbi:MAG: hypothetical protein Kow00121_68510 [Elainellaceae cyanobacterium]
MLKVTYTESGLHLEQVHESLEAWIARRTVLALRTSQRLVIEHICASVLLAADLHELSDLERAACLEEAGTLTLSVCDVGYVEASIQGIWLMAGSEDEGVFVAVLKPRTEQMLLHLWQMSQCLAFPIWR